MNVECRVEVVALQARVERVEVKRGEAMRGANRVAAVGATRDEPTGARGEVS